MDVRGSGSGSPAGVKELVPRGSPCGQAPVRGHVLPVRDGLHGGQKYFSESPVSDRAFLRKGAFVELFRCDRAFFEVPRCRKAAWERGKQKRILRLRENSFACECAVLIEEKRNTARAGRLYPPASAPFGIEGKNVYRGYGRIYSARECAVWERNEENAPAGSGE